VTSKVTIAVQVMRCAMEIVISCDIMINAWNVEGDGRVEILFRFLLLHGLVLSLFHPRSLHILCTLVYTEEFVAVVHIAVHIIQICLCGSCRHRNSVYSPAASSGTYE
jgi:hypothetical protein